PAWPPAPARARARARKAPLRVGASERGRTEASPAARTRRARRPPTRKPMTEIGPRGPETQTFAARIAKISWHQYVRPGRDLEWKPRHFGPPSAKPPRSSRNVTLHPSHRRFRSVS